MKKLVGVFSLFVISLTTNAQTYSDNYFDVGLLGGFSSYIGPLEPAAPFAVSEWHPAVGVFGRYNPGKWFSVRLGLTYGQISASQPDTVTDVRYLKDLSFKSTIFDLSLRGEFNLLGYHPRALEKPFSPFIFLGVSLFTFSPGIRVPGTNSWTNLNTATGQNNQVGIADRRAYSLIQFSIPMGFGVKYAINSSWGIGAEVGVHKTFTEYPTKTPLWYMIAGITVSYHFVDEGLSGSTKRGRSRPGCKSSWF